MEILIFLIIWISGVYFIKIKMELNYYRKKAIEHKDIYVPKLSEMMRYDHWSINLFKYLSDHLLEFKENISRRRYETVYKKELENTSVLQWVSTHNSYTANQEFNNISDGNIRSVA